MTWKDFLAQRRKDAKVFLDSPLRLCAFAREINLLRCGLYISHFGLLTDWKAQLHLHVSLDFAQHFRMIFQRLFRVFPSLAQPLAFEGKPRATLFHDSLGSSQIEQI